MGQRRGQAKQEGITVFVRVRASGAQNEGDIPPVSLLVASTLTGSEHFQKYSTITIVGRHAGPLCSCAGLYVRPSATPLPVFIHALGALAQMPIDAILTANQVVEINENQTSLCVRDAQRPNKSIECAFDRVFGPESVQEDVFRGLVPALDTVIKGFNACVLAYGQTGAGKTHTLIGTCLTSLN